MNSFYFSIDASNLEEDELSNDIFVELPLQCSQEKNEINLGPSSSTSKI